MNHLAAIEQLRAYYTAALPYYDLSLRDRGDLPFWTAMAGRWDSKRGSKRILELGCGTGRVTSVLCAKASTTAVDVLIEMLPLAIRRAPGAHFVVADLRELAFASAFDLVVLADDPMAHLTSSEERMTVMESIAHHLAPEGRLVLEGLYRAPGKSPLVPSRDIVRDGETLFTVEESWEPAGESALWKATYRYRTESAITEVASVLRSWTPEEVARLPACGLQVEALWGDFDERPFSSSAPRIVIVAKRRG
jgi:SAM-dependent methyltransferase